MKTLRYAALLAVCGILCFAPAVRADDSAYAIGRLIPDMRAMIGKPLLDQAIDFNNKWPFVLESLTPEGSRFFFGGSTKVLGETADDMRQKHGLVVLVTPCPGAHDYTAKVASVALWETLSSDETTQLGLGMEQLLAMMNTPSGVVTPSLLRIPRFKNLHGPVFEYVRGDTTETLSMLNEGSPLRLNWTVSNTGICPH